MNKPNETINILVVEPGKKPYPKEIHSDLDSLQKEVGGYIEVVYPFDEPVGVVCNEEGKLNGLPLNRALRDENGDVYDVLSGNFLVVGLGEEDFCSLTPEYMEQFSQRFDAPEMFMSMDGKILVLPMEEERPSLLERLLRTQPTVPKENKSTKHPKELEIG